MTRRKSICGRSLEHGPGSCPFWWESCPDKVKHCFNRYIREHKSEQPDGQVGIDAEQAQAWKRARDAGL